MKRGSLLAAILLLVSSPAVLAQSQEDEAAVIKTALTFSIDTSYPYVGRWVVSSTTEALEPGGRQEYWSDQARTDYASRNARPISLGEIALPQRAIIASLSGFGEGLRFNWAKFARQYPDPDTYTMRVSRPGFLDESHAAIRIDIWSSVKSHHPPLTQILQIRRTDGEWRCAGGRIPAVEPGR